MAENKRFVDVSDAKSLWDRMSEKLNRKLDSVTNRNESIEVQSGREISVKISKSEDNILKVKSGVDGGLYAESTKALHKLTFGKYVYDGSEDVQVAVYDGEYEINGGI